MRDPRSEAAPLTRGRAAARSGCNGETIRYYERVGLMPAPARSAGGHRLYDDDLVKRLVFIRRARALGFSLDEIRGLLALADGGSESCDEVKGLTVGHLAEIRRKIADLERIETVLAGMVRQCDAATLPDCPIIDTLFSVVDRPV